MWLQGTPVRLGPGREARLIAFYLGVSLCQEVNTAHIGELNQVDEHVGSFIGDPGTGSRILQVAAYLRIINPLQFCSELAHFSSQGQCQVTDRVPSSPAPSRSKATQAIAEDIELARHGEIVARRAPRLDPSLGIRSFTNGSFDRLGQAVELAHRRCWAVGRLSL